MSDEITPQEAAQIVMRRENPYRLDTNLAPVDWRQLREQFDPQGDRIPATDLKDRTFTIVEFRPVESSLPGSTGIFYYVRALDDDGVLFNTTLGGQAVVEVLESFDALRAAYQEAKNMGDDERAEELSTLGANRPFTVTLRWKIGGRYEGYYYLD